MSKDNAQTDGGVPSVKQSFGQIESSSTRDKKAGLNLKQEAGALAMETGEMGKSERTVATDALHEVLSDMIYGSNSALPREYNQNGETACIRAAKLLLSNHPDYGKEWLTVTRTLEDGREVEFARPLNDILSAAKNIGYNPVIEISVKHDNNKIIHQDNGIGMTAHELSEAFNTTGKSGVSYDADTGGKIGIGSLTYVNAAGMDGDMTGFTATRKPNAPDIDQEGIGFIADLDGVEEVNMVMPDGFRGTRFEIPVREPHNGGFSLNEYQEWVEEYSKGLRVPVLYKEYLNGETIVEEEYGGDTLQEMCDNPPVVVERPGEFTIVAGPDISSNSREDNCFLISMPIQTNNDKYSRNLFSFKIQIHNEQGLIVEGPNRGKLAQDVDRLHDDDVPLPQPKADRDSLQSGEANTRFFNLVHDVVKDREIEVAAEFMRGIDDPDDIIQHVADNPGQWKTFRKVLSKHGPSTRTAPSYKKLAQYCQQEDNAFPSLGSMTVNQWKHRCQYIRDSDRIDDDPLDVIGQYQIPQTYISIAKLFEDVSHAPEGGSRYSSVTRKKGRNNETLGVFIACEQTTDVFMAASTSGRFHDRAKVVWNTIDDAEVIVVDKVSNYDKFGEPFGFKKLKNVPYKESNNEDGKWDIPTKIKNNNQTSSNRTSTGKPDEVLEHTLKLRSSTGNSIDHRMKIKQLIGRYDSGGNVPKVGGHRHLVLFRRTDDENVSDNYDMADHATIASCTNEEYDALKDCSRVWSVSEYQSLTENTVLATTEGAMTAQEMIDDERQIIIAHVNEKEEAEFISDDNEQLRQYIADDIHDQDQYHNIDDYVWAVASKKTYERIAYKLGDTYTSKKSIVSHKHHTYHGYATKYTTLNCSIEHYQRLIDTPDWDDNASIYNTIEEISDEYLHGNRELVQEMILALHDLGIDPSEVDADDIRETIAE